MTLAYVTGGQQKGKCS